ncbi:MAG TPA: hypothetical protein VLJ11_15785 [Bryobacteraceae bacterium]|nr:hypothetical protein [Bryobacteraceae bacterium]
MAISAWGLLLLRRTADTPGRQETEQAKAEPEAARSAGGEPVLHLKLATQVRIGIRTQVLVSQSLKPELVAYGKLEENPSRSFVLRAPISGILHFAPGREWPSVGEHLADGAVAGMIEPRFTPAERISLNNQLTTAESELTASTATVSAARSAYQRAKILNDDNKNVSDQVLLDAAAHLQAEEARFQAANRTVRQIEASLQSANPTGSRQLVVERGGEVVELIAQPGEAIESGSPILRVAKLNELLARVNIPVGQHVPASVTNVKIVPVGFEHEPILAKRIAVAPSVDPRIQGEVFLFRLTSIPFGLRPGVAVTAYLNLPGPSQPGVVIPQSAVVRHQGLGFVYVQTTPDQFVRRQVSLDDPLDTGYFVTGGFQAGDRVVIAGAESLLSEEFKSQIPDTD